MNKIDVRGLSCPLPVLKTQKALEKGLQELQIIGTGNTAKENVSKFARAKGFAVQLAGESSDEWELVITKAGQ